MPLGPSPSFGKKAKNTWKELDTTPPSSLTTTKQWIPAWSRQRLLKTISFKLEGGSFNQLSIVQQVSLCFGGGQVHSQGRSSLPLQHLNPRDIQADQMVGLLLIQVLWGDNLIQSCLLRKVRSMSMLGDSPEEILYNPLLHFCQRSSRCPHGLIKRHCSEFVQTFERFISSPMQWSLCSFSTEALSQPWEGKGSPCFLWIEVLVKEKSCKDAGIEGAPGGGMPIPASWGPLEQLTSSQSRTDCLGYRPAFWSSSFSCPFVLPFLHLHRHHNHHPQRPHCDLVDGGALAEKASLASTRLPVPSCACWPTLWIGRSMHDRLGGLRFQQQCQGRQNLALKGSSPPPVQSGSTTWKDVLRWPQNWRRSGQTPDSLNHSEW